jgi:hypothetical protein
MQATPYAVRARDDHVALIRCSVTGPGRSLRVAAWRARCPISSWPDALAGSRFGILLAVSHHLRVAVEKTLNRVAVDLAAGRVPMARQRLRGLVGSMPTRLDLRQRLAEVYRLEGDSAQAG